MFKKNKVFVPAGCLAIALLCGFSPNDKSVPVAQQTQTETVQTFSVSLPSAFAGKTITLGGSCTIDSLNGKQGYTHIVNGDNRLEIVGWAFDDGTKSVPEMVFIELMRIENDGNNPTKYYATASRYDRADVAAAFKEPAYKRAGFTLKADIKSLLPGLYKINVIQIAGGKPILAPFDKYIWLPAQ